MKNDIKVQRDELKAIRLSAAELDKVQRLSPLTGKPGDFSATVRWLIDVAPEPRDLAAQAMRGAHNA